MYVQMKEQKQKMAQLEDAFVVTIQHRSRQLLEALADANNANFPKIATPFTC